MKISKEKMTTNIKNNSKEVSLYHKEVLDGFKTNREYSLLAKYIQLMIKTIEENVCPEDLIIAYFGSVYRFDEIRIFINRINSHTSDNEKNEIEFVHLCESLIPYIDDINLYVTIQDKLYTLVSLVDTLLIVSNVIYRNIDKSNYETVHNYDTYMKCAYDNGSLKNTTSYDMTLTSKGITNLKINLILYNFNLSLSNLRYTESMILINEILYILEATDSSYKDERYLLSLFINGFSIEDINTNKNKDEILESLNSSKFKLK